MAWVGAGLSLAGGLLSGGSAAGAGNAAGAGISAAAERAFEASKFRPVGMTTRFGSSGFTMSPEGYLTGANYSLSPELLALQDQIMGYTRQGLGDVGTIQNLGRGYLVQTPEQAASQWMQKQQALLQPSREKALADVRNNLFNTGREGLSVSQGGALGAANPELQAYYNALAQQDLGLASQAMQQGQNQTTYGLGLLSSAYDPFSKGLGISSNIENLGMNAFNIGTNLGAQSATAGARAGQALLTGATNAAGYTSQAGAYNPLGEILSGVGGNSALTGAISSLFG